MENIRENKKEKENIAEAGKRKKMEIFHFGSLRSQRKRIITNKRCTSKVNDTGVEKYW